VLQQNESVPHTADAQLEQVEVSGPPAEHSSCAQPPEHSELQAESLCASVTQVASHLPVPALQQYGSEPHTEAAHVLQTEDKASPLVQGPCEQLLLLPPQPPEQYFATSPTHWLSQSVEQQYES
jgi:hypothetical protein